MNIEQIRNAIIDTAYLGVIEAYLRSKQFSQVRRLRRTHSMCCFVSDTPGVWGELVHPRLGHARTVPTCARSCS
jgi:hypothetical protein